MLGYVLLLTPNVSGLKWIDCVSQGLEKCVSINTFGYFNDRTLARSLNSIERAMIELK